MANFTNDDLQKILARNPQLKVDGEDSTIYSLSSSEQKQGKKDALDGVVQREAKSQARVTVQFTFCRVRLVDVDAVASGAKDLLDGLQNAALIPGDSPGQIVFSACQKKVDKKSQEGVAIQIDYE